MSKRLPLFLISLQAIISIFTILFYDGTGDSGDSIVHFLFAKYAPVHPKLFFDHWAKPLFVILASPFAQFGFIGIKVFNSICALFTTIYTYKVAELMKLRNSFVVIILMLFAPLNYILTFSGLTEPMFALFFILGVYFSLKEKNLTAAIVISFLPYVRSEGLIIAGIFGLYFMYLRNWKCIPALAVGSLVFSIAGYFVYHDFLWVFTRIPYATMGSIYGQGPLTHFIEKLMYVVGVPIYCLFWLGICVMLFRFVKRKSNAEEALLVFLTTATFITAHSLFWYLGIFNSYGLIRVLVGIMPVVAIISLQGFNFLTEDVFRKNRKVSKMVLYVLLIYVIIFPFTINPAAVQWDSDLNLQNGQIKAQEVADFIKQNGGVNYPIIYTDCNLSMTLNTDPFDKTKCKSVTRDNISAMKPGEILIWDNVFAEFESGIKESDLEAMPELVKLFRFKTSTGPEVIYTGYKKR